MEQQPRSSINLSDDFIGNLIMQQQSSPADYVIDPSIIKYKFKLKSITDIIDTPIVKELLERVQGVKDVLDRFHLTLNTQERTIYKPREVTHAISEIGNDFILQKFISTIQIYKSQIVPMMKILPIFLTIYRNFQQQIKRGSRIIYEQENQRVITWDQEHRGEQKQIIIKAEKVEQKQPSANLLQPEINEIKQSSTKVNESLKVMAGAYHKIVKINLDKKQIRLGQLQKTTTQFQGMKAQKKDNQLAISIGRWKGEDPIEIITIHYVPDQVHPFLIYKKYQIKILSISTVWFIQQGFIKYYHQNHQNIAQH